MFGNAGAVSFELKSQYRDKVHVTAADYSAEMIGHLRDLNEESPARVDAIALMDATVCTAMSLAYCG